LLCFRVAELEGQVEQPKASEISMKNLFYREQEARQVLELDYKELAFECEKHMELQIASDRDLVNCYKSLQKLNEDCEALRAQLKDLEEAALPIARPRAAPRSLLWRIDFVKHQAGWPPTSSTWPSRSRSKYWPS
jgi:hypothetical protein